MTTNFKPFRFISPQEIEHLSDVFNTRLSLFNQDYCMSPLKLKLNLAQALSSDSYILCTDKNQNPLILIETNYLNSFQRYLFEDTHSDFTEISANVFKIFLRTITANEEIHLISYQPILSEWLYFGSPAITAHLLTQDTIIPLWFSPQWVKTCLFKPNNTLDPLLSLKKILASESLEINVELEPQVATITQLSNLKIGTLLKTTHAAQQPLSIIQKNNPIFSQYSASLGTFNHHKSIIIARKS